MVKNLPANAGDIRDVGSIPWRRAWQPTPVCLPGKYNGQRSLVGCNPWGFKESDTTEHTYLPCFCVKPQSVRTIEEALSTKFWNLGNRWMSEKGPERIES